jgi:hypothetical protein
VAFLGFFIGKGILTPLTKDVDFAKLVPERKLLLCTMKHREYLRYFGFERKILGKNRST